MSALDGRVAKRRLDYVRYYWAHVAEQFPPPMAARTEWE